MKVKKMNKSVKFISFLIISTLLSFITTTSLAASTPKPETIGGVEFVFIKGGSFVMGDILRKDKLASPPHRVTVGDFWIGKYEVTFDQYDKFCEATKREKPSDEDWGRGDRPVINVTWHDAVAFTQWLSKKTGKMFRLPSESEWEYAARGGSGKQLKYPWGNDIGKALTNCRDCGSKWDKKMTAPVGSFAPHGYGIYDLTGNVYEWTMDAWHDNYENAPDDGTAWDGEPDKRANRGGSWYDRSDNIYVYQRCWGFADKPHREYGFRVLLQP